jgi:hypothetical protein
MDEQRDSQPAPEPARPALEAGATGKTPSPGHPPWVDTGRLVGRAFGEWISRPRVRLAVSGLVLLFVGGLQLTSSVWTLPLVLGGAVMVATAWVGHRLEGSFSVEWGQGGTQLGFRARVKPAHGEPPALPPPAPAKPRSFASPASAEDEVIEGEAHTVEIDVAELKALIAAAETRGAGTEPPEATAEAIRIVRRAASRD